MTAPFFPAGLDTRAQGDYMHNLKVLCGEDPLDDLVALPPVLPQRTMACAQAMLGIAVRNGATSVQVGKLTGIACIEGTSLGAIHHGHQACRHFHRLYRLWPSCTMGCTRQAAGVHDTYRGWQTQMLSAFGPSVAAVEHAGEPALPEALLPTVPTSALHL